MRNGHKVHRLCRVGKIGLTISVEVHGVELARDRTDHGVANVFRVPNVPRARWLRERCYFHGVMPIVCNC